MNKLISDNCWFGCDWVSYEVGYLGLRAGQLSPACAVVYLWNTGYLRVTRPRSYPGIQQSRRLIAKELIFNCHLVQEEQQKKRPRRGSLEHSLTMVPTNKKIVQGRLVPCKTKYGKWKCTDCKKYVRSYCTCTPGLMFCVDCFGNHRAACATAGTTNTQLGVASL